MPMPTTRRGRFLWRRHRYLQKLRRWRRKQRRNLKNGLGQRIGTYLDPYERRGPLQFPANVSSASFNATPLSYPVLPGEWLLHPVSWWMPPHVKITAGWYLFLRSQNHHLSVAVLEYHARRVRSIRRIGRKKSTARARRITGANWFYFRNGYYRDDDPLGRHPNAVDIENGEPFGTTLWPVPLGY